MEAGTGHAKSREEIHGGLNEAQVDFLKQLQQYLTKYHAEKGESHGFRVRVETDLSAEPEPGSTPIFYTMGSCFNWKTGQWVKC